QVRLSRAWYLIFVAWLAMLLLPDEPSWSKIMLVANSLLVALPTLRASFLLRPHGKSLSVGAVPAALCAADSRAVLLHQGDIGCRSGHADRPGGLSWRDHPDFFGRGCDGDHVDRALDDRHRALSAGETDRPTGRA